VEIRDAEPEDGVISVVTTPKDWQRGTRNDPQRCAAARSLARALALSFEQVKAYGLAIFKTVAYVPVFDKKGQVETLRYKVGTDVHRLWDKKEIVKPEPFRLLPFKDTETLESKRIKSKEDRAVQKDGNKSTSKTPKKKKKFEVRGNLYHHHTCSVS
jgi:hypothetical protein